MTNPSIHDLFAAIDGGGAPGADRPLQPSLDDALAADGPAADGPAAPEQDQMFTPVHEAGAGGETAASFRDLPMVDLPETMRHLQGELERLQSEQMPQLRQRAVPGCPGCHDYDESYQSLLRHTVALQEAAIVASRTLKEARVRYAQALREAYTEQADHFENLSSNPRSLDSLNDAEQANLIPTFTQQLREDIRRRGESLAKTREEDSRREFVALERRAELVTRERDQASRQLDGIRRALSESLGASEGLIEQFVDGKVDLPGVLANVLGNADGAVKLNAAHATLWLTDQKPEGPEGSINASPTTLNAALLTSTPEPPPPPPSDPPPSDPAPGVPDRAAARREGGRRPARTSDDGEPARPPVVSAKAAPGPDADEEDKIKNLLGVLAKRGVVPASLVTANLEGVDDDRLKRLIQKMNRHGAGISWFAGEGDGLLAASPSFMAYYENWFEKFSEVDEEHQGYLGWLTVQKVCEQPQIAGFAPALTTLLKAGWQVHYPVRFQGVSGSRAPVGLHLVRAARGDRPRQDALLLYVPDSKTKAVPKIQSEQAFDVVFLYAHDPAAQLLPKGLRCPQVYGISRATGMASSPDKWAVLREA